jgi:hypothetical protein
MPPSNLGPPAGFKRKGLEARFLLLPGQFLVGKTLSDDLPYCRI